jgi:hypothetical protein
MGVSIVHPGLLVLRKVDGVSDINITHVDVARSDLPVIDLRPVSIADICAIVVANLRAVLLAKIGTVSLGPVSRTTIGSDSNAASGPCIVRATLVIARPRDAAAGPAARLIPQEVVELS